MTAITLDMGQYAAFVWPAWGISGVALGVLAARTLIAARRWSRALKDEERTP